ncbi:hypothetical protein Sango_2286700 [Sesamum angolense]|uniref:Reverse transcriptase zinc-binding domain-containing protein n=1 Tax=Sesamum angolense TaxID=2727404 RepID=A0AAE1WA05_9LAMI|nr:hypothetical protein Sango_2286700 [Sesamum angolense]
MKKLYLKKAKPLLSSRSCKQSLPTQCLVSIYRKHFSRSFSHLHRISFGMMEIAGALIGSHEISSAQVLKTKYFPRNYLFEAQVGTRSSYTWRSIIAATDLLLLGCRWKIGTEHSVDVWKGEPDLLIWHYSNNGLFDSYCISSCTLTRFLDGSSDGSACSKKLWRTIWQSKVPNKIKVFTWQAIKNAIPTACNLRKRLPHEEIGCPCCSMSDETTLHALLKCSFARQCFINPGSPPMMITSKLTSMALFWHEELLWVFVWWLVTLLALALRGFQTQQENPVFLAETLAAREATFLAH